ncbi:MAG: hypothetical protein ABW152_11565 [Candidatus Thiodiazotropha endolucinida]
MERERKQTVKVPRNKEELMAWLAFIFYLGGLLVKFISIEEMMGQVYTVLMSCAIMFTAQSFFLYIKRRIQSEYPSL